VWFRHAGLFIYSFNANVRPLISGRTFLYRTSCIVRSSNPHSRIDPSVRRRCCRYPPSPLAGSTMETRNRQTASGMMFDVSVEGDDHVPLVLIPHGFCVSRFLWNTLVRAVWEAGYFAVAPNQRGYAARARPVPADPSSHQVDRLIGDALDIVAAVGHGDRHFQLVGHDCGASLAWQIADQHPERFASLTIPSRPHP
jgi:alpha/beta hydrolase fold